jgi:hypothetical protein
MQMPESNMNGTAPNLHLPKVICGFDVRSIFEFIPQITKTHWDFFTLVESYRQFSL